MAKRPSSACPCTSGAPYASCCGPLHRGAPAPTCAALMRSRFAAFALGDGSYLWRTLHPEHPLRARPEAEVVRELSRARQTLRYQRLTVHDHDEAAGLVLFTAHVFEKGRRGGARASRARGDGESRSANRSFTELSEFERVEGAWRYREGMALDAPVATIEQALGRRT